LGAHGTDTQASLGYFMAILHNWYGLGTDPASLATPLVNPGVWAEVSLAYRELLDEYPQFSAGPEPDLAAIEAPGQQVAALTSALQGVDASGVNPAVKHLGDNYLAAFSQLIADVGQLPPFPSGVTGPPNGYGTPSGLSWAGFDPAGGVNQAVP